MRGPPSVGHQWQTIAYWRAEGTALRRVCACAQLWNLCVFIRVCMRLEYVCVYTCGVGVHA